MKKAWKSFDNVIKSSDHFLWHSATMTNIQWTSSDWIVWSVAHNLTKFLVYRPSQFHRFTEFRHPLHAVEKYVYTGSLI